MDHRVKQALKGIKTHESRISMFLGMLVVLGGGIVFARGIEAPRPLLTSQSVSTESAQLTSESTPVTEVGGVTDQETGYVVKEGEHLWQLAERFYADGYKWNEIARANNLSNPDLVEPGDELIIPKLNAVSEAVDDMAVASELNRSEVVLAGLADTNNDSVENNQDMSSSRYIVSAGDHLWGIAELTLNDGYRWIEIWEANKDVIGNPSVIEAGWELQIPVRG